MILDNAPKAVIYARVSSIKQTKEGHGLESQQARCEEFAKSQGYQVVRTFRDDVSGSSAKRPGMNALLSYLLLHKKTPHYVIIDDISRLARGIEVHMELRNAIFMIGATLVSPSIAFGEDSDSKLIENLLASVAQHQRQKNSEQVVNRMRARIMNGYWVFPKPIGYRYEKVAGHGKLLVPHEPVASIIREAMEGYAAGRFASQAEVLRYLESEPLFPKSPTAIHSQRISDILNRVVYAGYVEYAEWNVTRRKGHHQAIVSYETWLKVQDRMKARAHAPARTSLGEDFVLRGAVDCDECSKSLYSGWSKGRNGLHAYYCCHNKTCPSYGKSIRRADIEGQFASLLRTMRPTRTLFNLAFEMLKDIWNDRTGLVQDRMKAVKVELHRLEQQADKLITMLLDASDASIAKRYEQRLSDIENQRIALNESLAGTKSKKAEFSEVFRTAFAFLANPYKLWEFGTFEDKRKVLRLTFSDPLRYHRKEGFRTAKTTLPFKLLGQIYGLEKEMVDPTGIEPVTPTMST